MVMVTNGGPNPFNSENTPSSKKRKTQDVSQDIQEEKDKANEVASKIELSPLKDHSKSLSGKKFSAAEKEAIQKEKDEEREGYIQLYLESHPKATREQAEAFVDTHY